MTQKFSSANFLRALLVNYYLERSINDILSLTDSSDALGEQSSVFFCAHTLE